MYASIVCMCLYMYYKNVCITYVYMEVCMCVRIYVCMYEVRTACPAFH